MASELTMPAATRTASSPSASGLWILAALLAASIEPIVAKLGFRDGVSPLQLLAVRNIFAALTIVIVMRRVRWIGWRTVRSVAGPALLLLATNGLSLFALREMSAVALVTVMTTTPAFVALVSRAKGRVILGARFWLGFVAALLGVLFTVDALSLVNDHLDGGLVLPWLGILALLAAVASSTVYRTRLELLTRATDPRDVSTWIFLINASIAACLILPWVDVDLAPTSRLLPVALWTGVAAALANFAFLSAIRLVGATRMSIFDMLQRPLVIVFAAIAFAEPFTWLQGLGVALVLVGVRFAKPQQVKSCPESSLPDSTQVKRELNNA